MNRRLAKNRSCDTHHGRRRTTAAGFSLIELLVALLLGLVVLAGVCSVFIANQQVYSTNAALSDVQENSRTSFEMLAQNIREAGLLGCGSNGQVANVLVDGPNNGGTDWWANWSNALVGYGSGTLANPALTVGTAPGNQVSNTDSLMTLSATDIGLSVNTQTQATFSFSLNGSSNDLAANTIMIVCDPWQATIFRTSNYVSGTNPTIVYAVGSTTNCSVGLAYPTVCTPGGNIYNYAANSPIATLYPAVWYIGWNPVGTKSLYLATVTMGAGTGLGTPTQQEMVRGVTSMSILYNMANATSFVTASNVTNWASVDAVQVKLIVNQTNSINAGTAGTPTAAPIVRTYAITAAVRNRVQ